MPPLRRATLGYIAGLATFVVALVATQLPGTRPLSVEQGSLALATIGAVAISILFPLPFA